METTTKKYQLLFSDVAMGHPDLGWMKYEENKLKHSDDPDDVDLAYIRFLYGRGFKNVRVYCGYAWVDVEGK